MAAPALSTCAAQRSSVLARREADSCILARAERDQVRHEGSRVALLRLNEGIEEACRLGAHDPRPAMRLVTATPACTRTRSPGRRPSTSRPSICSALPARQNLDAALGQHGADLGHPALVRAGHADLVGALGLRGEQPGMLEDDVGQLPQQVVEQHEVARARGNAPASSPSSHTTWSAGASPSARPGLGPAPSQRLVRPQASARVTRSPRQRIGRGAHARSRSPGRESRRTDSAAPGPSTLTAGSARLPTMTGCTNSTATWRAWAGHCGATHHRVAPAANRRARARAAGARSSAGPAPSGSPAVRAHSRHAGPRPGTGRAVAGDRRLSQCEAAVVRRHDPVGQDAGNNPDEHGVADEHRGYPRSSHRCGRAAASRCS